MGLGHTHVQKHVYFLKKRTHQHQNNYVLLLNVTYLIEY
jgi:hypothetical protein